MRLPYSYAVLVVSALLVCPLAPAQEAQNAPPANAQAQPPAKGLPPRATPNDYQAHGTAGNFTLGAEFTGHSISTPDSLLTTEDYVVVEVGFFGAPQSNLTLSHEDFSLRINGKKMPVQADQYGLVFPSLKDPSWSPPEEQTKKSSKTSLGSGGGGGQNDSGNLPPIIHVPIELRHAMQQQVQKMSLPEGERSLPEAGLIFFPHRGKVESIRSLELIYSGPAGKVTLPLHP